MSPNPITEMQQLAKRVGAQDESPAEILRAYDLRERQRSDTLRKIWEKISSSQGNVVQAGRLVIDLMDVVESGLEK
jgi:hypothetical protein